MPVLVAVMRDGRRVKLDGSFAEVTGPQIRTCNVRHGELLEQPGFPVDQASVVPLLGFLVESYLSLVGLKVDHFVEFMQLVIESAKDHCAHIM